MGCQFLLAKVSVVLNVLLGRLNLIDSVSFTDTSVGKYVKCEEVSLLWIIEHVFYFAGKYLGATYISPACHLTKQEIWKLNLNLKIVNNIASISACTLITLL